MPEVTTPRRGRPGYDRQRVLDVVVGAFNEHGYDATSVSLLASTLGLSKSALYHHFTSKEEILGTALDTALGALEEVVAQPAAREGAAVERLEHVVRGAMRVLVEHLPYVTLLLRVRGNTEVERAALARRRTFDRQMTALITAAQDEGSLRRDIDARVAERLVFGMLNSVVEWYRPAGPETADQLADDLLKLTLDGLRAR